MNLTIKRKVKGFSIIVLFLTSLISIGIISTDIYVPATPIIEKDLATNTFLVNMAFPFYLFVLKGSDQIQIA